MFFTLSGTEGEGLEPPSACTSEYSKRFADRFAYLLLDEEREERARSAKAKEFLI